MRVVIEAAAHDGDTHRGPPRRSNHRAGSGPTTQPASGVDPGEWVHKGIAATIGVLLVVGLVWLGIQATNVLILVFVAILLAAGLDRRSG